jgi:hypothetical protein
MSNKDLREAVALLAAGDWQGAHAIVQEDEARYWYRKAGRRFSDDVAAEIAALRASLAA